MKEKLKDIRSLSIDSLRNFFVENKFKSFRGDQVYEWIWKKGIHDFNQMTNNIIKEATRYKAFYDESVNDNKVVINKDLH